MKIHLIGTGSIRSTRNSASALINNHILFDIPNGGFKAMIRQNIDILKIDTIIISHIHADHCFDIPFVLWYKKKYGKDEKQKPIKIITDKNTKKVIEGLIELSQFESAKKIEKEFIDFSNVQEIEIEKDVYVESKTMEHKGVEYATGYIIKDKNIKVGLTGDTCMCDGVKRLASNVDILISDMTQEIGGKSHMGINDIEDLLTLNENLKIIPTHMDDKTREKIQSINMEKLIILDDGETLNF